MRYHPGADLYALLKPVSKELSLLAAFFGLIGTALFAFAELFYFAPLLIMGGGGYLQTFSPDQLNALVLLSLKFYGYAGMIFTAYYGMGWIVRAYLIFRSGYLPKFLGVLMAIGGIGFVVRNFADPRTRLRIGRISYVDVPWRAATNRLVARERR